MKNRFSRFLAGWLLRLHGWELKKVDGKLWWTKKLHGNLFNKLSTEFALKKVGSEITEQNDEDLS